MVKALKDYEDAISIFRINPDPIIFYKKHYFISFIIGSNLNLGGILWHKLHCI